MSEKILPFFWMHGEEKELLEDEMKSVYDCGIRAICVESRPHPDFCGELWWRDMDVIIAEAKRLGMKVWILDDMRFPTGYANGSVAKNPSLRQWHIAARRADVMGKPNGRIYMKTLPEDTLLYAAAYEYDESGIRYDKAVDLSENLRDEFLFFDLDPSKLYRIMGVFKTREGGGTDRMDFVNPESVDLLINNVYELHYERYAEEFGKTIVGFFSDEPCFSNSFSDSRYADGRKYFLAHMGIEGMSYPFSDEAYRRLQEGGVTPSQLVSLWVEGENFSDVRIKFMHTITDLYSESFSRRVGAWCKNHGVQYIGHIIEDMNCHVCTGGGAGHYFKSQKGQTMAGIDIVLHQIKPYSTDHATLAPIANGTADPEFFYHTLGALAQSEAWLDPAKNGNAMCELYGAYGWSESISDMKYLLDLMLVSGINHFVPHAFSPKFPDYDCPPHFYAHGKNPMYPAFVRLMKYCGEMSELFTDGEAAVNIGVLYHAEADWSGCEYMPVDPILRTLHENQYNALIIPSENLDCADKLSCLIVPYAQYLPTELMAKLKSLKTKVIFGEKGDTGRVLEAVEALKIRDITPEKPYKNLRFHHYKKGGEDVFMFFNVGYGELKAKIALPIGGEYLVCDSLSEQKYGVFADPCIDLTLDSGASVVLRAGTGEPKKVVCGEDDLQLCFDIKIRAYDEENFKNYKKFSLPFDINAIDELPLFSGTIIASAEFDYINNEEFSYALKLNGVASGARVSLNGVDFGYRICEPYLYTLDKCLKTGKNRIEIELANTLTNVLKDRFSLYESLSAFGLNSVKIVKMTAK